MPEVKSVKDAEVAGKRVLVRADFNVPFDLAHKSPYIADDARLKAVLPTLELLHTRGASKIIILTHVGRPDGKVVETLRVAPIAEKLRELIAIPFELRENLRFDSREEANDEEFTHELASLGDIFVNEAFPVSHRKDASIVGVPKFLPSFMGLRFEEEIKNLREALVPPPGSVAILGGAKLETKLPLIEKFSGIYAKVLVGGMLANEYTGSTSNVVLPVDGVPERKDMLDIGPKTIEVWSSEVAQASFVLWNGPLGMYEDGEYRKGTTSVAQALAVSGAQAVVGGGDTINALKQFQFDRAKVFVSTGGGAMLEFLTTGTLAGIAALKR